MKKQLSTLIIATSVLTGSVVTPLLPHEVSAAAVQQKGEFSKEKVVVNGQLKDIQYTVSNKQKLYSASDLAKLMSATVSYDNKSKAYTFSKKTGTQKVSIMVVPSKGSTKINGKVVKLNATPKLVGNSLFVDAKSFIQAFGGDLVATQNGSFISVAGLISGDTFNPQWVNASTVLVSNETASGEKNYLINVDSKKSSFEISGTEVSVSPSGKSAIHTDEKGIIYLTNLTTDKTVILNNQDDNEKFEFVWSKNEDKVYFFNGKDTDKIYNVNVKDGALTKVYEDTFKYKSDLHLSNDGQKLIYSVSNEAKTNYTDSDNTDVSDIDLTDTEPQLFSLNLNATELKPLQLTFTKDNKVFTNFLNNGNIVYTVIRPIIMHCQSYT